MNGGHSAVSMLLAHPNLTAHVFDPLEYDYSAPVVKLLTDTFQERFALTKGAPGGCHKAPRRLGAHQHLPVAVPRLFRQDAATLHRFDAGGGTPLRPCPHRRRPRLRRNAKRPEVTPRRRGGPHRRGRGRREREMPRTACARPACLEHDTHPRPRTCRWCHSVARGQGAQMRRTWLCIARPTSRSRPPRRTGATSACTGRARP